MSSKSKDPKIMSDPYNSNEDDEFNMEEDQKEARPSKKAKTSKKPVVPTAQECAEKRLKLKSDGVKLLHKAKTIEARAAAVLATIKRNEAEVMKLDMTENSV